MMSDTDQVLPTPEILTIMPRDDFVKHFAGLLTTENLLLMRCLNGNPEELHITEIDTQLRDIESFDPDVRYYPGLSHSALRVVEGIDRRDRRRTRLENAPALLRGITGAARVLMDSTVSMSRLRILPHSIHFVPLDGTPFILMRDDV